MGSRPHAEGAQRKDGWALSVGAVCPAVRASPRPPACAVAGAAGAGERATAPCCPGCCIADWAAELSCGIRSPAAVRPSMAADPLAGPPGCSRTASGRAAAAKVCPCCPSSAPLPAVSGSPSGHKACTQPCSSLHSLRVCSWRPLLLPPQARSLPPASGGSGEPAFLASLSRPAHLCEQAGNLRRDSSTKHSTKQCQVCQGRAVLKGSRSKSSPWAAARAASASTAAARSKARRILRHDLLDHARQDTATATNYLQVKGGAGTCRLPQEPSRRGSAFCVRPVAAET